MGRVAVFVDAGYLFAAGTALIAGSKQPRHLTQLNEQLAVQELIVKAQECTSSPLLRVYWYDGVSPRGPGPEHHRLAALNNVKLRLGFINSSGQQKGVDSLIVTDLIELARNNAMSDAVVLAGDEDVRIGVQVAQSYGVRVHLLGVVPSRSNQSRQLMQEADTTHEWDKDVVGKFIATTPVVATGTIKLTATTGAAGVPAVMQSATVVPQADLTLEECATAFLVTLEQNEVTLILEEWRDYGQLPSSFDGRLLGSTRDRMGRKLEQSERHSLRRAFVTQLHARTQEPPQ
jgi:uncharacterized LabA/DUF88 family protein